MFSKLAERLRDTAAWRLSLVTSLAFALLTATAFLIAYFIVAAGIRARSDAWLRGENELLAQVVRTTPEGAMYETLVEEVAELARFEVLPSPDADPADAQPVFFAVLKEGMPASLWVGPEPREMILASLKPSALHGGTVQSVEVPGYRHPFRVASHVENGGTVVLLGFIDEEAEHLLGEIRATFLWLWAGMLLSGFVVSCYGARRILGRVEQITKTAARVGSQDLHARVPVGPGRDEISRLAGTLNDMLARIEGSVEQIRAVGDAVAHDLRSPLTAIRGNLELALTRGEFDDLQEAVASALEDLDRLLENLNAALDVAETEAGAFRLRLKQIDLHRLLNELVEIYRPAAEEAGLSLEVEAGGGATVLADTDLVRRALANLLDNAIQHLPAGSEVRAATSSNGQQVTVSVQDNGPGFPPAIRERAFERFVRGPASRGHGIGLALVQAAARVHGGHASLLDAPGGGSWIQLTFPRQGPSGRGAGSAI